MGSSSTNNTDGVEVYVDFSSSGDQPYAVQTIGREVREFEKRYIHLDRTATRVGIVRDGGRQRYEVRIEADVLSETNAIVAGQWLPFDVVIKDQDPDGTFSWVSWGPLGQKMYGLERKGALVLGAGGKAPLDRVELETLGEAGGSPIANIRMLLRSRDRKMPWTSLQSGAAGRLTLDLPAGAYEVRPESRSEIASNPVLFDTRELSGVLPVRFRQPVPTRTQLGRGTGHWRYFDSADGLPNDRAFKIAQDSAGNIWISQSRWGLTRYDGSAFQTYTAADGLLSTDSGDLAAFGDGIWVAQRGGVTFVSASDTVAPRAFEIPHGERPARVRALSIDPGGTLYASTSRGILSRPADPDSRDTTWTIIDSIDTFGTNVVVHNGRVHFAQIFAFVYEISEQGPVQVRDLASVRGVKRLIVGPEGDLWIVSPIEGLVRYGSDSQVDFFRTNRAEISGQSARRSPFRAPGYRQLAFDSGGTLWAIADEDLYTLEGERLRHVPTHQFGVSNWLTDLMFDREGYLWVTGLGPAVAQFSDREFTTFSSADGLPDDLLRSVYAAPDGVLWLGCSESGLVSLKGNVLKQYQPMRDGRPISITRVLGVDNASRLVFESSEGSGVFSGSGFELWSWYADTFVDSAGDVWVGQDNWVGIHQGGTVSVRAEGPEGAMVNEILVSRSGDLWIGWREGGITLVRGGEQTHFGVEDGLPDDLIEEMGEDRDGRLWVSTSAGYGVYDVSSWRVFRPREGLTAGIARRFHLEDSGTLWFSTNRGAMRFDGQVFQPLNEADGLGTGRVWEIASQPDGTVWFATSSGLTRYRPRAPQAPSVSVDAIEADRVYPQPEAVEIPSTSELVAFELSGRSVRTRRGTMVYRYRLTPHDTAWRTTGAERVTYQGLSEGDYRFEVIAVDRDLTYSDEPAVVTFSVVYPRQLVLLYSGLAVALVLVGWQTARVIGRDRRLRVANAELSKANVEIQAATERKSAFLASMSHELRTPMNAIKGFTNLVLRRGKDELSERNQENLQKVDQASDHLLTMLNDLLDLSKIEAGRMDVNPERFDVAELVTSACDTVNPLIQEGVELRQDVADDIGEASTDKARLQQMVINLLSNAIKFTDSGGVTVRATTEDGALVISVSDTGKGIPADELPTIFDEYSQAEGSESSVQKGTGLGLSITKKFAELLGGSIGVESEVGKGSTFTVRVPVEYQESDQ